MGQAAGIIFAERRPVSNIIRHASDSDDRLTFHARAGLRQPVGTRELMQQPRLSVLHVASADLWAGAEVQIYHLLRALNRRQDVRVGAFLLNEGELARRLRAENISVEVCDEARASSTSICLAIAARIGRDACDIVHTHRLKENLLGSVAALRSRRTRSVRTVHGNPEHRAGTAIRRIALRTMDGVATRLQQRIVGVSEDLCAELRAIYPPRKVTCIANGIDTRAVVEGSLQQSGHPVSAPPSVAFVGRFVPVKRVDVFLRAAASLCSSTASPIKFLAIGDGPLHGECVALARQLGISSNVEFPGFQPNALPIIRQASCVVLTSEHEGLPMVVLEALALGVPVVAPAVGGLPQVLAGISQCRLVSDRTPEGFAKAIAEVLAEGRAHPNTTPGPAKSLLPARYDIDTVSAAYVSLYRELCS